MTRAHGVVTAEVLRTECLGENLVRCEVWIPGREGVTWALAYVDLTGEIRPGDRVLMNTTAVDLGLGSGGFHFVMCGERTEGPLSDDPGHIMKLRYTPWQMRTLSVEEEASPHHRSLARADSIDGMPVVCIELHSQLLPVTAGIRSADPELKIAYIMTDGGSLPIHLSATVKRLSAEGWLSSTLTAGNSFGGEWEAVNTYSALLAARRALNVDVAVVGIGPGIVGTGTRWGHTGLHQAQAANAVIALGGRGILPLRISSEDGRDRHRGISHHSLTVLGRAVLGEVWVVMPEELSGEWDLWRQLIGAGICSRHRLVSEKADPVMDWLRGDPGWKQWSRLLRHMGRSPDQEPEFFLAACAAGRWSAAAVQGRGRD
ncbi:MAG: DUF3866 family protein [Bacillota bacterium]